MKSHLIDIEKWLLPNPKRTISACVLTTLVLGCSSAQKESTLGSLDIINQETLHGDTFRAPKTQKEIEKAYNDYLSNAKSSEESRRVALARLAEMEISKANAALKTSEEQLDDKIYYSSLQRTQQLLEASLTDYPAADGNDALLYRLARTRDQLGDAEGSLAALQQLIRNHTNSVHYAEAQFRLAERAFAIKDYDAAEDAYTEVIHASNNVDFRQRAYFKRGWSRYKQGLYHYALNDHTEAVRLQKFGAYHELSENERGLVDEYFRAIALAWAPVYDSIPATGLFDTDDPVEYAYLSAKSLSAVYLQQERYSDAAAVLKDFIGTVPSEPTAARAHYAAVEVWQSSKFTERYLSELESFYQAYAPDAPQWANVGNAAEVTSFREHVIAAATHYHKAYAAINSESDGDEPLDKAPSAAKERAADNAIRWYKRYLRHYDAHARKDGILIVYADLLADTGLPEQALVLYERAAYDGDLLLDKKSALAAIQISGQLYRSAGAKQKNAWLEKFLRYASHYVQLFPEDNRTPDIALYGAEIAYQNERYDVAINLSSRAGYAATEQVRTQSQLISARALLDSGRYKEAQIQLQNLKSGSLTDATRQLVEDNLALALYRSGELALGNGNVAETVTLYAQVAEQAPESEIAPQALYDGIVLAMDNALWQEAIALLHRFQSYFPNHTLAKDVTRRLSFAYLEAKQYVDAAKALEKVSDEVSDAEVQMAALWKAAEIYEQEKAFPSAIRAYRNYAHTYKKPFPQNIEAMYRLRTLYHKLGDDYRRNFWDEKIQLADRDTPTTEKTDRTYWLAARAWLASARRQRSVFEAIRLVEPLTESLSKKKSSMQSAIETFSHASTYGLADVSTEATFAIAEIYRHFADSLLSSERPANLTADERVEYDILLEDEAFPFEEMAVEFHEINATRIAEGTKSEWITRSLAELESLFPVRYARRGKILPMESSQ